MLAAARSAAARVGPACSYLLAVCRIGSLPLHSLVRMTECCDPVTRGGCTSPVDANLMGSCDSCVSKDFP